MSSSEVSFTRGRVHREKGTLVVNREIHKARQPSYVIWKRKLHHINVIGIMVGIIRFETLLRHICP